MIDIHCHILPGIDDGPETMDESVAMLRMAAEDGIETVVATPHFGGPHEEPAPELIRTLTAGLNERAQAEGLAIQVLSGCEVWISHQLPARIEAGEVLTLGDLGRYVLVEVPGPPVPLYALEVHFQLRLIGVVPVLAHAERIVVAEPGWRFVEEFADQGGLVQVNASALSGEEGRATRGCARKLFGRRLAHVIASDGHGTDRRRPILSHCLSAFPRRERATVLDRYCQLELGDPR
jgi:protein-tyrosine phosphatase